MDIKIPSENPIEIINPGNGEPGIAPCRHHPQDPGNHIYLCDKYIYIPVPPKKP